MGSDYLAQMLNPYRRFGEHSRYQASDFRWPLRGSRKISSFGQRKSLAWFEFNALVKLFLAPQAAFGVITNRVAEDARKAAQSTDC